MYHRLIAIALLALAGPAGAAQSAPPPAPLHAGYLMIGTRAIAYISERPDAATPLPLLVLFHGSGRTAQEMIQAFETEAAAHHIALLAVQATAATWDLIPQHFGTITSEASMIRRSDLLPRRDKGIADESLKLMTARFAIDPKRIGVIGFSDGAAYALSYGAADPARFAWVGGLSAAFGLAGSRVPKGSQRIFLAHGTNDDVLPYGQSQAIICPEFMASGRVVRFRTFKGGHVMDKASIRDALDDFLDTKRPPAGDKAYRCDR